MARRGGRTLRIVIDRNAALAVAAAALVGGLAAAVASQQLTMTATYPIPAGVYNQIITTGNGGSAPADTTLNRSAGNTLLVPPTNSSGNVGIGTASPASKLQVAGGVQLGYDSARCVGTKAGTLRYSDGSLQICDQTSTWETIYAGVPPGTRAGDCFYLPSYPNRYKPNFPATACTLTTQYAIFGIPIETLTVGCASGWSPAVGAVQTFGSYPPTENNVCVKTLTLDLGPGLAVMR
jgi:hypothetical protein